MEDRIPSLSLKVMKPLELTGPEQVSLSYKEKMFLKEDMKDLNEPRIMTASVKCPNEPK